MNRVSLNEEWQFRLLDAQAENLPEGWLSTQLPTSMIGTLLSHGQIPDPFVRDNELKALPLSNHDCEFARSFFVTEEMLEHDFLALRFEGIDTLSEIYVNDRLVLKTENMHRSYECELHGLVQEGENRLLVRIFSPVRYIKEENEKVFCGGSWDAMLGFPHLRKAHCMFGWDWGPRIPDMGIFRPVSLIYGSVARLESVYPTQLHEEGMVVLDFDITLDVFAADCGCEPGDCQCGNSGEPDVELEITVTGPDGTVYLQDEETGTVVIEEPKLWWPHGYGEQPLYTATVTLTDGEGNLLDVWEKRIGLRTVTVNQDETPWGKNFAHEVNGQLIFAMGADYIPEDNLLGRVSEERTRQLLLDAAAANHNSIRVWGGGYYPDDWFYDICDELGLLVWQDFMFSCANYELTEAFEENITEEIIQNIKRIRHHACLALWCGNNEMETQTLDKVWKPSKKQYCDYLKIFEYLIPKLVKEYDPATFYWPSSPSAGGNYDNPWAENQGDTHYWDVWHGGKPFTEFRKFHFAYLSEFGFQSFPSMRTVESFTEPEDRNIFSRVMEIHQRNVQANGKILQYMAATFRYPKDFSHLLYASQLLQLEAIRYGVEHFRRYRGRCMGTVVWQLNDIWPVASWSSIDYYGRWKALHYGEKRMFEPVHISCEETGELTERPSCVNEPKPIRLAAKLHVANETWDEVSGAVQWELRNPQGTVLLSGEQAVTVPAFDGCWLPELDFSSYPELEVYLSYRFVSKGETVSEGSTLFTPPKHFAFVNPELSVEVCGDELLVHAKAYARSVEIVPEDGDCIFSDNYFDMNPGEKRVRIVRGQAGRFSVRSVYDIG